MMTDDEFAVVEQRVREAWDAHLSGKAVSIAQVDYLIMAFFELKKLRETMVTLVKAMKEHAALYKAIAPWFEVPSNLRALITRRLVVDGCLNEEYAAAALLKRLEGFAPSKDEPK